jgi:hypothetical protein
VAETGTAVRARDDQVAALRADDFFDDQRRVTFSEEKSHGDAGVGRECPAKLLFKAMDVRFGLQRGAHFTEAEFFRAERVRHVEENEGGAILTGQVQRHP